VGLLNPKRLFLILLTLVLQTGLGLAELDLRNVNIPLEHKVKAAYIFNFARFVDWPDRKPESHEPIIVGILGQDQFTASLKRALKNQTVEGRPILVKQLDAPDHANPLHVLYIARSEQDELGSVLERVKGRQVLTVSETRHFLEQGGMVQLWTDRNRVQFGINVPAVDRSHLKVSSQMLQYAKNVN
jgi:hypothetical protein